MTFPRWLLPTVVTLGVLGIGYWFYRHRAHNPAAVPTPPKPDTSIELRFHDTELRGRKDGAGHWTIFAKQVDVSRDQRFAYLKHSPKGTFYNLKNWDPKGDTAKSRRFDWTGREAEYDTVSNNLKIMGKVVIITDAKEVLRTERVDYLADQEKVAIPGKLSIIGEKKKPSIFADQADADLKLEVLELKGHVRIDTLVGESEQIK